MSSSAKTRKPQSLVLKLELYVIIAPGCLDDDRPYIELSARRLKYLMT